MAGGRGGRGRVAAAEGKPNRLLDDLELAGRLIFCELLSLHGLCS
jgi:hypothetical protein